MGRILAIILGGCLAACEANIVGEIPGAPDAGVSGDTGIRTSSTTDAGADENAYPSGPYGRETGETIPNMVFEGYFRSGPAASGDYLESLSLQDIRDLGLYTHVLINVAAEWCVACREEAEELPEHFSHWGPRGGYVFSVITQDRSALPATRTHLDAWERAYAPNYSMAFDPHAEIANVLVPSTLPLNLAVDLRTMKILRVTIGEDPEFFQFFDSQLE